MNSLKKSCHKDIYFYHPTVYHHHIHILKCFSKLNMEELFKKFLCWIDYNEFSSVFLYIGSYNFGMAHLMDVFRNAELLSDGWHVS